jgi:hypothetical protein
MTWAPRSQPNIISVLEELSGVIEAVHGDREIIRVSGRIGDSQDVGVMGIDGFQELLRQTTARIEELEGALEPFAALAETFESFSDGSSVYPRVTVADLRAAAGAIKGSGS